MPNYYQFDRESHFNFRILVSYDPIRLDKYLLLEDALLLQQGQETMFCFLNRCFSSFDNLQLRFYHLDQ